MHCGSFLQFTFLFFFVLIEFYCAFVALSAYFGYNPDAHFVMFKRYMIAQGPNLCLSSENIPKHAERNRYAFVDEFEEFHHISLLRILFLHIDKMDDFNYLLKTVIL